MLALAPSHGLRRKIVLPLATGGSIAHLLAVDHALKPVSSALGARDMSITPFNLPRFPRLRSISIGAPIFRNEVVHPQDVIRVGATAGPHAQIADAVKKVAGVRRFATSNITEWPVAAF